MKKLILVGNVTSDATVSNAGGSNVINFTIAVNEKYTSKNGTKMDDVSFFECAFWRNNTEFSKYITKGKILWVEGSPEIRTFKKQDGTDKSIIKVRVTELKFIPVPKKETAPSDSQNTDNNTGDYSRDSDFPADMN